jgi:hypothetical protein
VIWFIFLSPFCFFFPSRLCVRIEKCDPDNNFFEYWRGQGQGAGGHTDVNILQTDIRRIPEVGLGPGVQTRNRGGFTSGAIIEILLHNARNNCLTNLFSYKPL